MSAKRKLSELFDYQRFVGNKRLQALIDDTERRRLNRALSDDELERVNAAGEKIDYRDKKDDDDKTRL